MQRWKPYAYSHANFTIIFIKCHDMHFLRKLSCRKLLQISDIFMKFIAWSIWELDGLNFS